MAKPAPAIRPDTHSVGLVGPVQTPCRASTIAVSLCSMPVARTCCLLLIFLTPLAAESDEAEEPAIRLTPPDVIAEMDALLATENRAAHANPRLGYTILAPPGFRKHPDPQSANPDFDCLFLRGKQHYVAVIAEDLTGNFDDFASFAAAVRSPFVTDPQSTLGESEPKPVDGATGELFTREADTGFLTLHFCHWVGTAGNRGYQVLTWGAGAPHQYRSWMNTVLRDISFAPAAPDRGGVAPRLALRWPELPEGWHRTDQLGDWQRAFHLGFIDDANSAVLFTALPLAGRRPTRSAIERVLAGLAGVAGFPLERDQPDPDTGLVMASTRIPVDQGHEYNLLWYRWRDDVLELGLAWTRMEDTLSELRRLVASLAPQAEAPQPEPHIAAHLACSFGDLAAADRRTQVAIDWYRYATRLAPSLDTTHKGLLELLDSSGRWAELIAAATTACEHLPDHQLLRGYRAIALATTGDIDAALADAHRCLASGFRDQVFVERMLDALESNQRLPAAIAFAARCAELDPHPELILRHSRLLAEQGQHAQATAVVDAHAAAIDDRTLLRHRALLARERDALDQARELLATVAERWGEDPEVLLDRAHLALHEEEFHTARGLLERCLQMQPGNVEVQELLLHIKALLGEGSRVGIVEHLDPVPLPPTAVIATKPFDARQSSRYTRHQSVAIDFRPGERHRCTERVIHRVIDRSGVQELADHQIQYDPLSELITINELAVYGPDGELRWQATPGQWYQLDQQTGVAANYEKTIHVPVQGLAPGCELRVTTTTQLRSPPERIPFRMWVPAARRPLQQALLWVTAPAGSVAFDNPSGLPVERTDDGWLCTLANIEAVRYEPMMADPGAAMRFVSIGSPQGDWGELVREYLTELEPFLATADLQFFDQIPPDPAVGLARIQDGLAYQAVAFGDRGRIPRALNTIQSGRSGDCKDHSLLVWHYLRHLGIEARLALVSEWDHLAAALPSLDQFDHMVVVVPQADGYRIIDATAKQTPAWRRCPPSLVGHRCLVLDPDRPDLFTIADAGERRMARETHVTLDAHGNARVAETITVAGPLADQYRFTLEALDPHEQEERIQSWLGMTVIAFDELRIEQMRQTGSDLVFALEYRVANLVSPLGDMLVGRLPAQWEHGAVAVMPVKRRLFPFRIPTPAHLTWTWHLNAPTGWRWHEPVEPLRTDGRFFNLHTTAQRTDDTLILRGRCELVDGLFPAAAYEDLYGEYRTVLRASRQPLVLHRQ